MGVSEVDQPTEGVRKRYEKARSKFIIIVKICTVKPPVGGHSEIGTQYNKRLNKGVKGYTSNNCSKDILILGEHDNLFTTKQRNLFIFWVLNCPLFTLIVHSQSSGRAPLQSQGGS